MANSTKFVALKVKQITKEGHEHFGKYEYQAIFKGDETSVKYQYTDTVPDLEELAKFLVNAADLVG